MQPQILVASAVMAHALGWMTGSSTNGSWENYYMAAEHMHITNLFSNNCIKMVNFL
jgi:hypothetical protein